MKLRALILSLGLVAGSPAWARADTAADLNHQVTTMNNATANQGQTNVINKMSDDFSSFLGADSKAVVTGLRNGTPITLTSTTTAPNATPGGLPVTTTTATTITPPTGRMGFGNVYTSLALAKQQLSTLGITQPTPEQLNAALTGGTITQTTGTGATATTTTTNVQGILAMRSQKMGWGQIAKKLGVKLGPVIASMKHANQNLASAETVSSNTRGMANTGGQTRRSESGIVSGSGKSHGNSNQGITGGKSSGDGIVTGSGRENGNAYGHSRGTIITGSGRIAGSSSGIVSAGGGNSNGAANVKGHGK